MTRFVLFGLGGRGGEGGGGGVAVWAEGTLHVVGVVRCSEVLHRKKCFVIASRRRVRPECGIFELLRSFFLVRLFFCRHPSGWEMGVPPSGVCRIISLVERAVSFS